MFLKVSQLQFFAVLVQEAALITVELYSVVDCAVCIQRNYTVDNCGKLYVFSLNNVVCLVTLLDLRTPKLSCLHNLGKLIKFKICYVKTNKIEI